MTDVNGLCRSGACSTQWRPSAPQRLSHCSFANSAARDARAVFAAIAAAGIAGAPSPAAAQAPQSYPEKPIRFIVPFTAGGTSDFLARLISTKMSERWGQPVVVENRAGAGGTIAANIVAKATATATRCCSLRRICHRRGAAANLPYDPLKDFAGVTQIGLQHAGAAGVARAWREVGEGVHRARAGEARARSSSAPPAPAAAPTCSASGSGLPPASRWCTWDSRARRTR